MEAFIEQWGHVAVYLGTLVEGEVAYLSGILASQLGHLSLGTVVLVSFLGAVTRDGLLFLGTRRGGKYVINRPGIDQRMKKASNWIEGKPNWLLIFYRFFYGISSVMVMAMSLSTMSLARYFSILLLASALWSLVYGTVGYLAAPGIIDFFRIMGNYSWLFVGIVVLAVVAYFAIGRRNTKII